MYNDDMRDFIAQNIDQNYQVLTANDGEQGVQIASAEIPDLIISDIMMPKLNGYQVTKQLRSQTTTDHIPIILLTAKDDQISRMKGWHEKADEYLTKPFDVDELNVRVRNLLDIRDILKKRYAENVLKIDQQVDSSGANNNNHPQDDFLNSLNQILLNCYTDSQLKIPEIASKMAMSERQLFRKTKGVIDMTPTEYLRKYRLESELTRT